MITYSLGNVEELRRPDQVPPAAVRHGLVPGDWAKLIVLTDEDYAEPEDAWVQVKDILGPDSYWGEFESGEGVGFGPENVADVAIDARRRAPAMSGLFDSFEKLRERRSPFEILREPRERRRSPFEILREPPGAPPPEPAKKGPEAPSPAGPKKPGFFRRVFERMRKKAPEVTPIPGQEMRPAPTSYPELPAPRRTESAREEPPPASPAAPAPTAIILPAEEKPVAPPSAQLPAQVTELPPPVFDLLVPEVPLPPESKGLIIQEAAPTTLPAVAPDIFEILAPAPPAPEPSTPATTSAMTILPEHGVVPAGEPDIFEMLVPQTPMPGTVVPITESAFEILAPEPPSIFDILAPASPSSGTVAPYVEGAFASPFDILEPEAPSFPVTPFDPEQTSQGDLFSTFEPEPGAAEEEAAPPPRASWGPPPPPGAVPSREEPQAPGSLPRGWSVQKGRKIVMPTPAQLVPWIESRWVMPNVWHVVRKDRTQPDFQEAVFDQYEGNGEEALIPLETVAYYENDWPLQLADALGIPEDLVLPYVDEANKIDEEGGDSWEVMEELRDRILYPYYTRLSEAFSMLKPKDIPGEITVANYEDQIILAYWEGLPEDERRRIELQRQEEDRREQAAFKARYKTVRKIWGPPPTPKELKAFIQEKFDLDALWAEIRKERKTKGFKRTLEGQDDAIIFLEKIAEAGDTLLDQIGYYFSIPPDIMDLYRNPDAFRHFWNEFWHPYTGAFAEAFTELLPKEFPGEIHIGDSDETDDNAMWLMYVEQPYEDQ